MKFKSEQTSQKLRGGYYTPQNIADYTTKWVLGCNPKSILEPSCGDGAFFQSLYNNKCNSDININGFELFDIEAQKSNDLCKQLKFNNTTIPYSKNFAITLTLNLPLLDKNLSFLSKISSLKT